MRHGLAASTRPPRLVLRFALYTALTLVVAAAGFLWFVHRYATAQAERAVRFHAGFVADSILRSRLREADFERLAGGERRRELDRLFRREVLVGGALRVKLYGRDGTVTYSNAHDLIGTPPAENAVGAALGGSPTFEVTNLNHEGGRTPDSKVLETYVPVRLGGRRPAGVFELYQDYGPVAGATRAAFVPIAAGLTFALLALYGALFPILRRVTRRLREHVDEIEHQALHDHLTGLPNRLLFRDRVEQAALAAVRELKSVAVLLLDLDRFKDINDTLGHESGDRVLEEVALRLRARMRASDTVARLGGDEFAVLAHGIDDREQALVVAEKVRAALAEPLTVAGLLIDVDASVGLALAPEHGTDVEALIRCADIAMYVAKEHHTGAELYSSESDHHSPERLQLVAELRQAIALGELVSYYQPQASLAGGDLRGVEALVRWPHPVRGLLAPRRVRLPRRADRADQGAHPPRAPRGDRAVPGLARPGSRAGGLGERHRP